MENRCSRCSRQVEFAVLVNTYKGIEKQKLAQWCLHCLIGREYRNDRE